MDPLKLFVTLETPLTRTQLLAQFTEHGWNCDRGTGELLLPGFVLSLEHSGGHSYLMRGWLERSANWQDQITPLLAALAQVSYSLDVFEEDGRLIGRMQR